MCNQAVGLLQGEIERAGISTVSISLLRDITEKVKPPRALFVPFNHGFPLGKPNDAATQKTVMRAALSLLTRADATPPLLEDFPYEPPSES